jgi:MerR family transcriptional regulator, copper efflux regulator
MLISEFSKATGLPTDTIRFYVRKGLLQPERGSKGGANPYQIFRTNDVTTARMIRLQQALGYSLREIAALHAEYRSGATSPKRTAAILRRQIGRLEQKQADIETALNFLRGKLDWIAAGQPHPPPTLDYRC